ncbi:hypothetical protein FPV67DRAFT_885622 [Lyophyllum atratum]|nr:hypothetical protein FPV67DRAFT_885622 [Lyophyllum atratum]
MSVQALPLQPSYPWIAQSWGPMPYSPPTPAGHYGTQRCMTTIRDTPQSSTHTTAFLSCYYQKSGYAMPANLASFSPDKSASRLGSLKPSNAVAIVEPVWSSSWPVSSSEPPPHNRSLYATIPLPPEDNPPGAVAYPSKSAANSTGSATSSSSLTSSPPQKNPSSSRVSSAKKRPTALRFQVNSIKLHDSLQNAGISVSPSSPAVESGSVDSPAGSPLGRDEPATSPSVINLTLVVDSTGEAIQVRPSSPASPQIVTVGDVLDELEDSFVPTRDVCCGTKRQGTSAPVSERISVILKSIHVWWRKPDGSEAGRRV